MCVVLVCFFTLNLQWFVQEICQSVEEFKPLVCQWKDHDRLGQRAFPCGSMSFRRNLAALSLVAVPLQSLDAVVTVRGYRDALLRSNGCQLGIDLPGIGQAHVDDDGSQHSLRQTVLKAMDKLLERGTELSRPVYI